jgi:uncharacterized protein (DUF1697 family)
MARLRMLFESLGCSNVSTYINSGNVLFESGERRENLYRMIDTAFKKEFNFDIPLLIKTRTEIRTIARAVPAAWLNDASQKTDVAYLFDEIDSKDTIEVLPVKKEFIAVNYVKGAIIWNVKRENAGKSNLSKIIGHKIYRFMTVRNVNTARYLAEAGD